MRVSPPDQGGSPFMHLRSARAALQPELVPMPNRSRRARHPVVMIGNAIFTLLVIVALAAGAAFYFGREKFQAPGPLAEAKVVNIPRGLGIKEISDLLSREGVIDQPYVFMGGVVALKARGELKYGEYRFAAHASVADVVDTMMEGKVVQHAFHVPEGLTSEQIVARLQENDILTGQITHIPAEGSLLPETYKFTRGTSRQQVIDRMQQSAKRALEEIWARRDPELPLKSPQELVTLASIVEKETGKADERTRVAAVFVNRLRRHMRLQSDPTIIYGLAGGKGSLGHGITVTEKAQPTPYNTYVIDGLPPGPIGNPGRASLEAVANPARTKELYFVADGSGGHVFSETYEQHQKYVGKLREREDEAAESPAPVAAPAPAPVAAPKPAAAAAAAPAATSSTGSKRAHRRAAQPRRAQPQQPTQQ
jgi:peptidoglycan lytic transglycosylase G